MEERRKHKVMIGIELALLCIIVAILGTSAASSNPPSSGVSYSKNSQTTVEGALNDLYTKANYGDATAAQILKGKEALVKGKQVTGTMPSKNGSSKAIKVSGNSSNLYMVFPYGYYPAETHFSTGNSSEVYASNADVASAIGLTAGKLLKGQTVLGITGTGETTCPTCESQGYYKYYKFDKDATYTRTSTGTNTTLGAGDWKRLCAAGKTCVYTFSVPLDSGIKVNKLYSCNASLRIRQVGNTFCGTSGGTRKPCNGFRIGRGYAANSTTAQYWYMTQLTAAVDMGDVLNLSPGLTGGSSTKWGEWNNAGWDLSTSNSHEHTIETSCSVSGSNFIMTVEINDNGISTYNSEFMLAGSITYQ